MTLPDPILYKALLDHALEKPLPIWSDVIDDIFAGTKEHLERVGLGLLREAYTAGLRDGFQQGVQAAAQAEVA